MKKYVPIVIGIVALCAVLYAGSVIMKNRKLADDEKVTENSTTTFKGKVVRMFEGENVLEYSIDLPQTATTTVERDGSLIKVRDMDVPVLAMYVSYEGGRGYTPEDYIANVIKKSVPSAKVTGTSTVGLYDWSVAESAQSVWHVGKAGNGEWLLVIENKKADSEKAEAIIESISTN